MEDESIFTKKQPKEISEGLQSFIDSMVEEIVLEGKPFETQKKYLKKFSENEGLDYDKLEADITTFIEVLDSFKSAFSKLQVKLAEEKGKECYVSDEMVEKLVSHSSPSQTSDKKTGNKILSKKWFWATLCGILAVGIALFILFNDSVEVSEPTGMTEGHGWVDMGLPSGIKWATCNVGSSVPSDLGNGFAWGETDSKTECTWETYDFRIEGDSYDNVKFNKYNTENSHGFIDNKVQLEECDDVAHIRWGGNWRMPTAEDVDELLDNCTFKWGSLDGKKGYKVTSKINGNSIFFPKVSKYFDWATYWTSTLYSSPACAYVLFFDLEDNHEVKVRQDDHELFWDERCNKYAIRPVLGCN